jgi:hypothetical protein
MASVAAVGLFSTLSCGGSSPSPPTATYVQPTSVPGQTAWPGSYQEVLQELYRRVPALREHISSTYTGDSHYALVIGIDDEEVRVAVGKAIEDMGDLPPDSIKLELQERLGWD